jgi:hypothetical protein
MKFIFACLTIFAVASIARADLDPKLAAKINGWNYEFTPTSNGIQTSRLCGVHVEVSQGQLYLTNILPPSFDGKNYDCSSGAARSCRGLSISFQCNGNQCGDMTILDDGNIYNASFKAKAFQSNQGQFWWCQ